MISRIQEQRPSHKKTSCLLRKSFRAHLPMPPEPMALVLSYVDMQSEVIEFDLRTVVFAKSDIIGKHLGPDQFAE